MMKFLVDLLAALVLRLVVLSVVCAAAFGVGYVAAPVVGLSPVNGGMAALALAAGGIIGWTWWDGRKDWTR